MPHRSWPTTLARMSSSRRAAFDRSMVGPALFAFVLGVVVGIVLEGPLVGLAIGLVLAMGAVGRRYAAARMQQGVDDLPERDRRGR